MVVECKLSNAEMHEAFRMNLSRGFWFRAVLSNLRALVIFGVVIAVAGAKLMNRDTENWGPIGILLGFAVAFVGLYLWRFTRRITKTAEKINAAGNRITLDGQGLTTVSAGGSTTFTPWPQVHKWKEGRLVFTIGDAKLFRTIPKSALGEMQVHELRGLLQTQVR